MKIAKKFIFITIALVLFTSLTMSADAAKKSPVKKTVKKPVANQVVKKVVKPVAKPVIKPVIKPVVVKKAMPWHDNVLATQFYIGENGLGGTTAWDCHAVAHYGGIDSPFGRNGYLPAFKPKENSFYLALPYTDIGEVGTHKKDIPWYDAKLDQGSGYSFVKNRWVQVKRGDKVCYGQWEDSLTPDILDPATGKRIGYGQPNHFDYVFGSAPATHPGIDVSPALSDCLGMRDVNDKVFGHADGLVSWKFVNENEVPSGAWKNTVTVTPVSWENCK